MKWPRHSNDIYWDSFVICHRDVLTSEWTRNKAVGISDFIGRRVVQTKGQFERAVL